MNASPSDHDASVPYLLRIGDLCLIHAQRLSEWCGHAPALEEELALANVALDLLGQARLLLSLAGEREGRGRNEDALAFLRSEHEFLNVTLVELPRGDFAVTVTRNLVIAAYLKHLYQALSNSPDPAIGDIALKASKEVAYHLRHAAQWCVRLGQGTDESRSRMLEALKRLWPYVNELFMADEVDGAAAKAGLAPECSTLREPVLADIQQVLAEAGLELPVQRAFVSHGKQGRHSEHMGYLLAQMQYLQRAFPQGQW